ncbi:DNA internalization-related competence protein ComEC/Rec2 [uncultured Lactobacillus sp.]|uniref:DNA internalization-related competence protein ComEC/Rec2 n=1 Tax=uncultured Lactobacillus sp. TaxID=153152 RepID=UPI002804565A|nr:DNA internalization-related competence protein ComEC/Rec2 [uncultured Lactobacillus sp.]
MQVSKTNWLFKNDAGLYLIVALLLVALSFWIFVSDSIFQKLVCILFSVYFLFLLVKKYRANGQVIALVLLLFASAVFLDKRVANFELTKQTHIKIYPDQVRVKDNFLSGIGHFKDREILIAGKIADEQKKILKSGQPIIMSDIDGKCEPIEPATNIGEFNYQNYYAAKKIFQRVKFTNMQMISVKPDLIGKLHQLRYQLQEYFNKMPQLLGFFASELILGENNAQENQEVLTNYRDLGVIHLLSISGLHVGIYVLIISTLCYSLKMTDEETFLFCALILLLGIFLSNGQAGFVRASLTYALGKICKYKGYHLAPVDLLGLTCVIHMLCVPRLFMAAGALLSYILALGLQLTDSFSGIKQSILLNLLLTPLLLLFFYQVNFLTVLFNMLVVPYFNWVVMPLAFINALTFGFTQKLAPVFERILELGEQLIGRLSKTKLGLLDFGQINWWQCLLLLIVMAYLIIALREKPEWNFNAKKIGAILCVLYAVFFSMIHFPLRGQVTFIDVGQGDSILITTPFPRKAYLIDTGGKLNFSGKKITPQINRITIPFLKSQGINTLDGVFVSHQDADHVGDLGPLLEQVRVKKLFMAQGLIKNPSFQKRIDGRIKHTELVELLAGMQVKEPQITFNVVYPYQPGKGKNEDSLSLFFRLANRNWLFTGDLGQEGESEIMQKTALKVDYFKLGHHGSKTSSKPEFLKAIQPKMVFISAGRNNRFGHPHQETLMTLASQQIPWVSTQDCGMISWYYGGMKEPEFNYFLKRGKK